MFKKLSLKGLFIVTLTGMVVVFSIYIYRTSVFTFDRIDSQSTQKEPGPIALPTVRFTADAFYELYDGAAGGVNVWIEVTDHNNQELTKAIYYSNDTSQVRMEWADKDDLFNQNEVSRNTKSLKLNVKKGIYHDAGLTCRSLVTRDKYETCYLN